MIILISQVSSCLDCKENGSFHIETEHTSNSDITLYKHISADQPTHMPTHS